MSHLATGLVTYLDLRTRRSLDADEEQESLERLDQVMTMYEDTQ
jgi:hypothetical protein